MIMPELGAISSKEVDKKPFNFKLNKMHILINLIRKKRMTNHLNSSNSGKDSILTLIMKVTLKISQKIWNQTDSMLKMAKLMQKNKYLSHQNHKK